MKILFTSNFFPPETQGGYELRLLHLAHALIRQGHECVVVSSKKIGDVSGSDEDGGSIKVIRTLSRPSFEPPQGLIGKWKTAIHGQKQAIQFADILQQENPDWVCHFSHAGWTPALSAVANVLKIPQCFWYEDTWSSTTPVGSNCIYHPWFQVHQTNSEGLFAKLAPLVRFTLPTSKSIGKFLALPDHVGANLKIAVSHFQEWQNRNDFVRSDRSVVIQSGVPFPPSLSVQESTKGDLKHPIQLIYAGALTPDRGFEVLFEAMRMMEPSVRSKFHLTVVGKAPNEWANNWWSRFQADYQNDPTWEIIDLKGWIAPDKVGQLLTEHDALVFPSQRGEGMPLIMQEAMLNGCLIYSTGCGGAGELCSAAGIPTYPYNCPAALNAQLLRLLQSNVEASNERRRLRDYAIERFSVDSMAKQFIDLLATGQES